MGFICQAQCLQIAHFYGVAAIFAIIEFENYMTASYIEKSRSIIICIPLSLKFANS